MERTVGGFPGISTPSIDKVHQSNTLLQLISLLITEMTLKRTSRGNVKGQQPEGMAAILPTFPPLFIYSAPKTVSGIEQAINVCKRMTK